MNARTLTTAALALFAISCRGGVSEEPPFHLIPDMDHQGKFKAQAENTFFADGRAMRPLVDGTLAQNQYHEDEAPFTGKYADGLGNVINNPARVDFDPIPWQSMAVWMLTQMKRWGYLKADVDYKKVAEQVFLLTDARKTMKQLGQAASDAGAYPSYQIMGKAFNPLNAEAYANSFAIKRH